MDIFVDNLCAEFDPLPFVLHNYDMEAESSPLTACSAGAHMPQFAAEKAAAAIGYLVQKTGADLYPVMKMLYLADKVHLGKYGRTIAGDRYVAMPKGPVPDRSYNLLKYVKGQRAHFDPLPSARDLFRVDDNKIVLLRDPDLEELSRSDVAALDAAIEIYARGGWRAVFRASHDAAWKAAWDEAKARDTGSIDMAFDAIASTLENGAALIEYLADPHPGEAPTRGAC